MNLTRASRNRGEHPLPFLATAEVRWGDMDFFSGGEEVEEGEKEQGKRRRRRRLCDVTAASAMVSK